MKTKLLILLVVLFVAFQAKAGEITLSGVYLGKNLYVQNPFIVEKMKYCTESVFVNGKQVITNPKNSSFEIDLSKNVINAPVVIKIVHSDGCKPKIINPSVIKASSTFQFTGFTVEPTLIRWSSKGEAAASAFYVEKFENNNWRNLRTVNAQNAVGYAVEAKHTAGVNKYRIKYVENNGKSLYTQPIDFTATSESVRFFPKNVTNKIYFTSETTYEILDLKGTSIKKGKSKEIDATGIRRGVYYLNFDGKTERFLKK